MAIIYEEALKKQLSPEKLAPVYILFGDDGYLKRLYTEKIIKLITDKDDIFNYQRFDSECDLQDVYDSLSQLPVMADKKCVVLCDYDFEHCAKSELEKLYKLAEDTYDTSVLIILFDTVETDPKKNSKFKKLIAAAEKGRGAAVQLNHRRPAELIKMLTDGAAKRGCRMEAYAAKYLLESAGDDIETLKNELEKLCFFKQHGSITKADVDFVCIKTAEASVYNLSKQILERNVQAALKTLGELFFMQLEPMIILYTVSSCYVDIYRVYLCRKSGMSIADAAAMYGYKGREFVLERAAQNLNRLDKKRIKLSFEALLEADRGLKTSGGNAQTVLVQLIIRLIYIAAKGESVDKD